MGLVPETGSTTATGTGFGPPNSDPNSGNQLIREGPEDPVDFKEGAAGCLKLVFESYELIRDSLEAKGQKAGDVKIQGGV